MHPAAPARPAAPLCSFGCGQCVKLAFLCLDPKEAQRLRELGLCEGAEVRVVQKSDGMILGLSAGRLAVRQEVAMKLFATEVPG